MQLSKLINKTLPKAQDVEVTDLTLDSRQVQTGSAFFALKGTQDNGQKYINDAIKRGAVAILVEDKTGIETGSIPVIAIKNLRQQIGEIAANFFEHPSKELKMFGVTGTSGKTSCTHYIAQILNELAVPCGIIGTLGQGLYGQLTETNLTTPDAISLQRILRKLVQQGAKAVAMEVSSHSIDQGRINGMEFDVGIFTNLSQDHLDYHGDMETYAEVKKQFITQAATKQVIINSDDIYGKRWINELSPYKSVFAYSINKPQPTFEKFGLAGFSHEDILARFVYAESAHVTMHHIQTQVRSPWGLGELTLPLVGLFNLSNALAVLAALCANGFAFKDVMQQISSLKPVVGRMQILGGHSKPWIVVDYAHKPDALEKVLQTLKLLTKGRLVCVFGCGGERDQSKRPLMAKVAEHYADHIYVTSDNPRHENPEKIAKEILSGFVHRERVIVELDRAKAIQKSIQSAQAGDCVLIAGKGAEHYQILGDKKIHFDDVEQVQINLEKHPIRERGELDAVNTK